MSSRLQKFFAIALLLVAALIIYYFIITIVSADASTRSAIIAALAAGSVALVTNVVQKRKDISLKQREQKIPAYDRILTMIKETFLKVKNSEELDEKSIITQTYDINQALLMAGSAEVLLAWKNYHQWLTSQDIDPPGEFNIEKMRQLRLRLAHVIRMIRKDLNHNDSSLSDEDIADLIIPLDESARALLSEHQAPP